MRPGTEAVCKRSCSALCPPAVKQFIAGIALPSSPRRWGSALHEFDYTLPLGSEALCCSSSTPHYPEAVWQCVAGIAVPAAPRQ